MLKYAACNSSPGRSSTLMPASYCVLSVAGSGSPALAAVIGAAGVDSSPSMYVAYRLIQGLGFTTTPMEIEVGSSSNVVTLLSRFDSE